METINNEIFEDIKGFEGYYKINRLGQIMSIIRKNVKVNKILKSSLDRNGYPTVQLSINRTSKSLYVHRLVAIQFIENPQNKPQVNHIDGCKENY